MNWLGWLFPTLEPCFFCERRVYQKGLCRLCLAEVEFIESPICEKCGKPVREAGLCLDCLRRNHAYFVMNRSAVHYNHKMKEIVSLYKFRGQESLADMLAGLLVDVYQSQYAHLDFDAITYVPLHEKRMQERGFNQAEQLSVGLGSRINLPVLELLTRIRFTEKQSKKHRAERLQTLRAVFELKTAPNEVKRVLLVDDVYTTGTTVNECARVLSAAGMEVYSLTVAR